jgi:hypothetical protein
MRGFFGRLLVAGLARPGKPMGRAIHMRGHRRSIGLDKLKWLEKRPSKQWLKPGWWKAICRKHDAPSNGAFLFTGN